jgi:hypothetical protein
MPYASRPSVDVEVEPGDTLYATMAKAADLLDVRMEDGSDPLRAVTWIAFYDARDDDMLDRSRYISARDLTLVDESGLLTWRNTFEQTSLAS